MENYLDRNDSGGSFNPYQYQHNSSVNSDRYPGVHSGVYVRQPISKGYKTRSSDNGSNARITPLSHRRPPNGQHLKDNDKLERTSKYLRFLVVLICVGTFFYYVTEFFHTFQEYPTVVDVSVEFKDYPDIPAITICNHNLYRRSDFCPTINELNLNSPEFSLLCQPHSPTTNYVNHSDYSRMFTRLVNATIVSKLAHNETQLFKKCRIRTEWGGERPFVPCRKPLFFNVNGRNCFVLNSMWFEYQPDYEKKNDSELEIEINLESYEYLINPTKPAAEIYIHSRTAMPDARTMHFTAKGGNSYTVGVIKTSLWLLEPPYQTGCMNYTKEYEKSGGKQTSASKAQISQQETALGKSVCRKLCQIKKVKKEFNCIPYCLPFTKVMDKCQGNKTSQNKKCVYVRNTKEDCTKDCPVECNVMMYDIQMSEKEGFGTQSEENGDSNSTDSAMLTEDKNFTKITINLQLIRHSIYTHKAKITSVEILGYVGGYLGIFLGVSIPMLFDTCVTIIGFFHRRYQRRKWVTNVRQRPIVHQ